MKKHWFILLILSISLLSSCSEIAEPSTAQAENRLPYQKMKLEDIPGSEYIVDERTGCLYVRNDGSDAFLQLVQYSHEHAVCGEILIEKYFDEREYHFKEE